MASRAARKDADIPNAPKRKQGQRLNQKDWETIVVYALRGHSVMSIARMSGFHERSIRRFMTHGFPTQPWGTTPIRALIEQEQAKARALRERIGEDRDDPTPIEAEEKARIEGQIGAATLPEREAAKQDALASRVAEGQLVKLARGNVVALAGAAVGLVGPASRLAAEVGRLVVERVKTRPKTFTPEQGLGLLRQMASYLKDIVDTGQKTMEMERLLLGDPTGGGNKLASDAANMTLDDAMTELGNAAKVHAAIERRGWKVHTGGGATIEKPPKQTGITLDAVSSVVTAKAEPTAEETAAEDPTP